MPEDLICETPDAVAEICGQLKYLYQYFKDFHMEYFVCDVMQEGINLLHLPLRNIYLEYFLACDYAYRSVCGEISWYNAKVFLLMDINLKIYVHLLPLYFLLCFSHFFRVELWVFFSLVVMVV